MLCNAEGFIGVRPCVMKVYSPAIFCVARGGDNKVSLMS